MALLLGTIGLSACGADVKCSQRAPDATFVGTLVARDGSTATFVIESVLPPVAPASGHSVAPALEVGQRLNVHYFSGAQFLRVGMRYQVAMALESDGEFESAVPTANECAGGTTYANGKAIDTSWWKQHSWVHPTLYVMAVLPLVVVAIGVGTAISTRRRKRRAVPN